MPTMISVVGDEANEKNRGKLNSLMYCGLPVGAIFVASLAIRLSLLALACAGHAQSNVTL